MLLDIFELAFVVIALWLAVSMVIRKFFMDKLFKDNIKASEFVAFMGILITIYSVVGLLIVFFVPNMTHKIIMLLVGLSPYIIGKFAKYERENLFSMIQLAVIVFSIFFVSAIY